MNEFNYPYGYGKLETAVRFLAINMLSADLIKGDQHKAIEEYIDTLLARVNSEVKEYSKNS